MSGLASGVVEISAGAYHTCARTGTGGLYCWGHPTYGALGDGGIGGGGTPVAVIGP